MARILSSVPGGQGRRDTYGPPEAHVPICTISWIAYAPSMSPPMHAAKATITQNQ